MKNIWIICICFYMHICVFEQNISQMWHVIFNFNVLSVYLLIDRTCVNSLLDDWSNFNFKLIFPDVHYKQDAKTDKRGIATVGQENWPNEWNFGCNGHCQVNFTYWRVFPPVLHFSFVYKHLFVPNWIQMLCMGE